MHTRLVLVILTFSVACSREPLAVGATYDETTGKLTRLTADLTGDGKIDTWTYMEGTTPLRTEQDLDGDGKIERWEFPGPDGKAVKVAESRRHTGRPDMWTYLDPAGEPVRIESASGDVASSGQEPKIDRIETYAAGLLIRVEEDTDADGRMDKWEQHDSSALASVEFDYDKDGKPDERISFGPGGKVLRRQKLGGS